VSTQETSSTPADSEPWMCGRATLVTVTSSTCMTVTSITEPVMAHLRAEPTADSPIGSVAAAVLTPARECAGLALGR
jgi:hypothetical protein